MQQGAVPAQGAVKKGIFYGWVIVVITGLLQFTGGTETFPVLGLFLTPMTDEMGWSKASFSAPMTIGTIIGGFAGILVGPAIDKYGARWIMTVAAVVLGGTFFMMSFVQELWQHFALQIIARAVTAGAFFLVVGIVLPKWFVAKRGRATAFSGIGGRLGQFLTPILVQTVIAVFGWRAAWTSLGLLVWAIAIVPVFFFLKGKPEDMGLLPDGLSAEEAARLRAEEQEKQKQKQGRRARRIAAVFDEISMRPKEVLRERSFYFMLIAQSMLSLVISGLHFHWFSYMTSRGLSDGVAVASISVSSLVGIPVSFLAGYLAERIHVRYILAVTYVGFALTVVILIFTHTPLMAYTYGIALGAFSGVTFTVSLVIWADYYGRGNLGAIRGMTSPISQVTNASGPLVAALAYDFTGSYTAILWTFVAIAGSTSFCWLLATPPKRKPAPDPEAVPVG